MAIDAKKALDGANEATLAMLRESHPDAAVALVFGGFLCSDPELEKNIGRYVQFKPSPDMGKVRRSLFQIIGVQKIYDGRHAYRVRCMSYKDTFGRPALPDEVEFARAPRKKKTDAATDVPK